MRFVCVADACAPRLAFVEGAILPLGLQAILRLGKQVQGSYSRCCESGSVNEQHSEELKMDKITFIEFAIVECVL